MVRRRIVRTAAPPSPLSLGEWRGLLSSACGKTLDGALLGEAAEALHSRFTHWVRQRFKDDFTGDTPAKGRAYAALQMALFGGLYGLLGRVAADAKQAAGTADHIKIDTEAIRDALDAVAARVDALAADPLLVGRPDGPTDEVRRQGTALLNELRGLHAPLFAVPGPGGAVGVQGFVFRNERIALFGRGDELAELGAWLDDPRPFSWDLWTGPAGAGKSRLALHLCKARRAAGWRTGFYDWQPHATVRWDLWTPARPSFIVFDYVHEHAAEIGAVVRVLAGRSWGSDARVRVLLLEREVARAAGDAAGPGAAGRAAGAMPTPPWLDSLLREGPRGGGAFDDARADRGRADPERPIGGVSKEAVMEIIRADAALAGEDIDEETYSARCQLAIQIDPRRRPLFVAMAAEAVRKGSAKSGVPIDEWDVGNLVDVVLNREMGRWLTAFGGPASAPGGTDPEAGGRLRPWRRLACLATACDGLRGDARREALRRGEEIGLPKLNDWDGGRDYRRLIPGGGTDEAAKLEPDIIGEAFVLWQLAEDPDTRDAMIGLAWRSGMGPFLARAAGNFPGHPMIDKLLEPRAGADPQALAAAHAARSQRALQDGNRETVSARGRALALDEAQPALIRALGVFMWTQATIAGVALDEVAAAASALAKAHPDDAAVRELLAKGLFNAFNNSGADIERADGLLDELRTLRAAHPDDAAVREPLASGLNNAIYNSGGDTGRADGLLGKLRALYEDHPDAAAVREQLAKGLVNAIFHSSGDSERADGLLDELRTLRADHPDDDAVREALAGGLFNAFNNSEPNSKRADGLLGELRTLRAAHPEDAAVRERLAKGLVNAIAHSGGDSERADGLLGQLRTLRAGHPDDAAVREQLAKGLFNAFCDSPANSERADRLSEELEKLLAASPAAGVGIVRGITEKVPARPVSYGDRLLLADLLDMLARVLAAAAPGAGRDALDAAAGELWAAYRNKYPGGP